jgi:hypothetical protein
MTRTVLVEIAILLGVLVMVEWLVHTFTNTRQSFLPAVLVLGAYWGVRTMLAARKRES